MMLFPEVESAWCPGVENRPLVLVACGRCLGHRLFGCAAPPWRIAWGETAFEVGARFMVGALLGLAYSVPMIAILFWPGRRGRPSFYESLHQPSWIGWALAAPFLWMVLRYVMTSRASLR